MLVILNTMLNNNSLCLDIATTISSKLNNYSKYTISGYKVDFTKYPTEAYNSKNELVYRARTDDVEGINAFNNADIGNFVIESIKKINTTILDTNKNNNLFDNFYNMLEDFEIEPEDFEGNINDVVKSYKSKKTKVQVIIGVFSKIFIEKIQKQIGKSNVIVYNITRNPSTTFLFNTGVVVEDNSLQEYNASDLKATTQLYSSALSAYTLSKLDSVTTIAYEDILVNNKININGVDIDLHNIMRHNANISKYEYSNLIDLAVERKDQLSIFNNKFQNMHECNGLTKLPNNLFECLDYAPLTYDEIVS